MTKETQTINGIKPLGNRKTIDVRGYSIELIEICHDSIKDLLHPLTKITLWWSKDEMACRIEAAREGYIVKSVDAYEMLSLEAKELSACLEQRINKEEKPVCEMTELCGKTIDDYSKEELWVVIEDFLKPEIKTEGDLNREVEFFIDSCKAESSLWKKASDWAINNPAWFGAFVGTILYATVELF